MTELKARGGRGRWAPEDSEEAGELINKAKAAAHCLGICHNSCGLQDK